MGKKKPTAGESITIPVIEHGTVVQYTAAQIDEIKAVQDELVPVAVIKPDSLIPQLYADYLNEMLSQQSAYLHLWNGAESREDAVKRGAWKKIGLVERVEWLNTYCLPELRPVLELHQPEGQWFRWDYPVCEGCEPGRYAEDSPDWPCATWNLVEQLTVEAAYATP